MPKKLVKKTVKKQPKTKAKTGSKKKQAVYTVPKEWCLPFLASWRAFERAMNPAFYFIQKCGKCGATGADNIVVVHSNKKPEAILGIQCKKCGQTLKFEGMLDPDAKTFPERLRGEATSVLVFDGQEIKPEDKGPSPEDVIRLIFG